MIELLSWLPALSGPKTFCASSRPRPAARATARMMPVLRLNMGRLSILVPAAQAAVAGGTRECRGLQRWAGRAAEQGAGAGPIAAAAEVSAATGQSIYRPSAYNRRPFKYFRIPMTAEAAAELHTIIDLIRYG